jgi:endonuclease/exonuclease/phosphatase family metal-dependent hydrolase
MRFMLYNLRYCTGTGSRFHIPFPWIGYLKPTMRNLERITAFIHECRPDVVGLVEVDVGSFRSRRENQAAYMAEALGHYHLYESKYSVDSVFQILPVLNKQVNAFLTRNEIQDTRFHYFEHGIKRLVIELELRDVTIFLVHLSLKFRHRHSQLNDLYDLVRKVAKPCIVAGDFNAFWGDDEMALFLAATGLRNANADGRPSYPSRTPRRQLDFILHSADIRVTGFDMPPVTFSDHLPLVCDFEIGA